MVCHTIKYSGYAIMLWGAIKGDGSRALVKCSIKLNSEANQNVLDENLVELYDSSNIFMQDNAMRHKSASTLTREKVCLLSDWPPQSPYLSIIKNLWATLNRQVSARYQRNSSKIWVFAKEVLENIPNEVIHTLYTLIPKRLQGVLKNNGRHCKY